MPGAWSYNRLPTAHEARDQDITDAVDQDQDTQSLLRPLSSDIALRAVSNSNYSLANRPDGGDRTSINSFETFESASSGTSLGNLKNLGARISKKPLPRYLRGSVRRHAAADVQPARIGRGVWADQLLSDRSFRTMALTMSLFAVGMIVLIICYAEHFTNRGNRFTSSVGGKTEECRKVTYTNTIALFAINICATIVLGMSNTYQQIVTSLKISDLKHALSRYGDSRVGTNSPLNINHKKMGRKRAWAAWLLLIATSMPVHFLANSLIGPSYTQELPKQVKFTPVQNMSALEIPSDPNRYKDGWEVNDSSSFPCWSAFRTGKAHFPKSIQILQDDYGTFGASEARFDMAWDSMTVYYFEANCTKYRNQPQTDIDVLEMTYFTPASSTYGIWKESNCYMGTSVKCSLHDPRPAKCRLNICMSAAFILMACLVVSKRPCFSLFD